MRRRRQGKTLALGPLIAAGSVLAACDTNDGRDMEPPSSAEQWLLQNTTPSTSSTTTTLPPETLPPTTAVLVETVVESVGETLGETTTADNAAALADDSGTPGASGDAADASLPVDTFAASLGLADLAAGGVEFTGPWPAGAEIPVEYTCNGAETAPLLTWTAPPEGTAELALVVKDETADDFVHWIVIALPAEAGSVGGSEPIVVGSEASNSAGETGWAGPCPPDPTAHTYRFTLYALSQAVEVPPEAEAADLIEAIEASATGAVSFTGTYQVA